jgi:hypothetical protein
LRVAVRQIRPIHSSVLFAGRPADPAAPPARRPISSARRDKPVRRVQVSLHAKWLCRAGIQGFPGSRRLPSAGGPSLRTYVLADHKHTEAKNRRSQRLRPGSRIHAARGRPRAPRPRRRADAAPRTSSIRSGRHGSCEPAGTHQTQETPRPWRSGRSTARRVPGHRRSLRIGRFWRRLRRRHARPAGRRTGDTRPPASDGAPSAGRRPPPGRAAAVPASLHLTRGSTASLPAGCDRARRTRLRAGRLGHTASAGPPRDRGGPPAADRRRADGPAEFDRADLTTGPS